MATEPTTNDSIEFETSRGADVTVTASGSDFGGDPLDVSVESDALTFDGPARLGRKQGTDVLDCGRQKTAGGKTVEALIPVGEHKADIEGLVRAVEQRRAQATKDRKAEREAERKAAIPDAKLAEAEATGERVAYKTARIDCRDPHEECSTDIRTTYVTPEGDIEHGEWTHTY